MTASDRILDNRNCVFRKIWIALVLAVGMAGCTLGEPCHNMRFGQLISADRVVITDNGNRELRVIVSEEDISQLVKFADAHGSGWFTPWFGTPIALVRANFFDGEDFLGDLGVGDDFLTAQGCGGFQLRKVSTDDRELIMSLFAVEDPYSVN